MSNPPCVADIVQPLAGDDWVSEPGRHQDTSRRQARRYFASRAQSSIRWGERQHLATEAKALEFTVSIGSTADADRWTEQPSPPLRTSNTSIVTRSASATDRSCGRVAVSIGLDTFARIPTRREELMAGPKGPPSRVIRPRGLLTGRDSHDEPLAQSAT